MRPWYDPGYISTDPASHSQSAQKIFRKHFRNISKPEIFWNILRNVLKYIAYAKSFERFCMLQDLSKDCATINLLMYLVIRDQIGHVVPIIYLSINNDTLKNYYDLNRFDDNR